MRNQIVCRSSIAVIGHRFNCNDYRT